MHIFNGYNIIYLFKKIVEVLVGLVDMWITGKIQRKHSLSTCGQTVCKYQEVIHIIERQKAY
jgi:hypothetical protein